MTADKKVPRTAKVIGANLRYLREASGLSQKQLGRILGISYQQVQKYENGLNRFPVEKLYTLRHYYNVPYDLFFRDFPQPPGAGADSFDLGLAQLLCGLKDRGLCRKIEQVVRIILE